MTTRAGTGAGQLDDLEQLIGAGAEQGQRPGALERRLRRGQKRVDSLQILTQRDLILVTQLRKVFGDATGLIDQGADLRGPGGGGGETLRVEVQVEADHPVLAAMLDEAPGFL